MKNLWDILVNAAQANKTGSGGTVPTLPGPLRNWADRGEFNPAYMIKSLRNEGTLRSPRRQIDYLNTGPYNTQIVVDSGFPLESDWLSYNSSPSTGYPREIQVGDQLLLEGVRHNIEALDLPFSTEDGMRGYQSMSVMPDTPEAWADNELRVISPYIRNVGYDPRMAIQWGRNAAPINFDNLTTENVMYTGDEYGPRMIDPSESTYMHAPNRLHALIPWASKHASVSGAWPNINFIDGLPYIAREAMGTRDDGILAIFDPLRSMADFHGGTISPDRADVIWK